MRSKRLKLVCESVIAVGLLGSCAVAQPVSVEGSLKPLDCGRNPGDSNSETLDKSDAVGRVYTDSDGDEETIRFDADTGRFVLSSVNGARVFLDNKETVIIKSPEELELIMMAMYEEIPRLKVTLGCPGFREIEP